jgi:transcription initiation factor TFIID TATA-box-binding protein
MASIKFENIIASTTVKGQMDLELIHESLPGSQYNPDVFPGLMYHQRAPKSVIFLFRSGRMLITGPNSYDGLNESIDVFLSKVKRSGFILSRASPLDTKDIAASLDLGKDVDLDKLARNLGSKSEYDPDNFPALIFSASSKIKVLVFPTGKIVSTGTRNSQETKAAFEIIIKRASL